MFIFFDRFGHEYFRAARDGSLKIKQYFRAAAPIITCLRADFEETIHRETVLEIVSMRSAEKMCIDMIFEEN